MPLSTGAKFGPYEILAPLGAGGMGEVYRARDKRLDRDVALKILSESTAANADRRARFERETRAVAALNHPNIVSIYDVGSEDGIFFMVSELVEGESLRERISRGHIPVREVLQIAVQIADGMAAAHSAGFVHRDLKPENIMLTTGGRVKILDFGLARQTLAAVPEHTVTLNQTAPGAVLGTVNYMSPEQARGTEAGYPSDQFSFGMILYEMATGNQAFRRDTTPQTLTAILVEEPAPIEAKLPAPLRWTIDRCLAKDPKARYEATRDLYQDLRNQHEHFSDLFSTSVETATAPPKTRRGATRPVDLPLMRLSVDLGPDAMTDINLTAVVSPDGQRLVFPARGPDGKLHLATRLLDQAQSALLPGTDNGRDPFFSPDSQWVGFYADGKLKKISTQGGAPVTLCDAPYGYGASWGEDGTIVAALNRICALSRVPAAGGRPQPLTELGKGEVTHRWPQILPGGKAVLFTASPNASGTENARIEAAPLQGGVTRTLVAGGYFGRYLPASASRGYLVYLHQGVLFGVAFDPGQLELQGTPIPLLEDVASSPIESSGQFDYSAAPSGHGTFVYLAGKGAAQTWPVVWLDSSGNMQPLIAASGTYSRPRFSPDGQRLALNIGDDLYVYELEREAMTRLTFGGNAGIPVWSPDGKYIAFGSSANTGIQWVRSDGSGEQQQIFLAETTPAGTSFSSDGRRLAYFQINSAGGYDIFTLPLDTSDPDHPQPGKPEPFLITPANELLPMFSPDGRWIAYRSDESGTNEIYVRPFPGGRGGKWQISTGGGLYGIWSNNNRELFYETADNRIMVVEYMVNGDSFAPGKPRQWSDKQIFNPGVLNLALAPDGERFAVFPMPEAAGTGKCSVHVTFLLNFLDELKRRIPAAK